MADVNNSSNGGSPPQAGGAKLWIVAVLLGLLFVGLYNFNSCREARQREAETVYLVKAKVDLEPGTPLDERVVEPVPLPAGYRLEGHVRWDQIESELGAREVGRRVNRTNLLSWDDIAGAGEGGGPSLSQNIDTEWRTITLPVDPQETPWAYLRQNDRVDIHGALSVQGQGRSMQLIIEAVRVVGFDEVADNTGRNRRYRSIVIAVPKDQVPLLLEVKRRVVGPLQIAVRNPQDLALQFPYDRMNSRNGGRVVDSVAALLREPYVPPPGLTAFDEPPLP